MFVSCIILFIFSIQQVVRADYNCSSQDQRIPGDSDLVIDCGIQYITLTVNLCPVLYSEISLETMALNGDYNYLNCLGTMDNTTNPPVIRYTFPINDTNQNTCDNSVKIVNEGPGTGVFADYSSTQSVVISGYINALMNSSSIVSYTTDFLLKYSCHYPLEYFLNNTMVMTSSGSVAITTNNGSFISTLSMKLYADLNFSIPLTIPNSGILLNKKIFVEVRASNLSSSFNILLDTCFATPSPVITTVPDSKFNFFTGCVTDKKTKIFTNGIGQTANFCFDAFRFVEQREKNVSTIYVHCMTRLCASEDCKRFLSGCSNATSSGKRKRRAAEVTSTSTDQQLTLSTGPIQIIDTGDATPTSGSSAIDYKEEAKKVYNTLTGLIVGFVIAAVLLVAVIVGFALLCKKYMSVKSMSGKRF
ncbi:zona pellucida-like domain-containing protein 1 [Protopterus annectens]|uniref:zona pellucida-like domain-containing protein 1 n=1 Tax=Protopterus annectens TaxID=7888 RepID=UPI001CFC3D6D|nr:zona pellucida-like domain-containing protein 1 [Protopterus annectens]